MRLGIKSAIGLAAILVLFGSAVTGPTAWADPWGTGTSSTGSHPDEDPHTYCVGADNDNADAIPNIDHIMWDIIDPTQVNVNEHTYCQYTGSSETDIVWQTSNLNGTIRGRAYCEDFEFGGGQCDQYYAQLDMVELAEGSRDEQDEDKTVCHEAGHTMGLTHGGTTDCMLNGERPKPIRPRHERYNSHHLGHINSWF